MSGLTGTRYFCDVRTYVAWTVGWSRGGKGCEAGLHLNPCALHIKSALVISLICTMQEHYLRYGLRLDGLVCQVTIYLLVFSRQNLLLTLHVCMHNTTYDIFFLRLCSLKFPMFYDAVISDTFIS